MSEDLADAGATTRNTTPMSMTHAGNESCRETSDALTRGLTRQRVDAALGLAIDWLCAAHEATGRRGLSAGYDPQRGWLPSYPETTGYTIYTLLRAGKALSRPEAVDRAGELVEWLMSLQLADGSFPGDLGEHGNPVVFDTGQVVLGLVSYGSAQNDSGALDAGIRGAQWLSAALESDGAWRRSAFRGFANSYSTRVSWAVLAAWSHSGDEALRSAGTRSLMWVLGQVDHHGWIEHLSFRPGLSPYTHTIAYCLRGLQQSADILQDDVGAACLDLAQSFARRIGEVPSALYPLLPGELAAPFMPDAAYACLTGDAQMVTVWLSLSEEEHDWWWQRAAHTLSKLLELQSADADSYGSLGGSYPPTGAYETNRFPEWATKFLADALINFREKAFNDEILPY